jgi:hypothetical protein
MKKIRRILHRWLIPGEHNNFRAHLIRHDSLLAYTFVALAFLLIAQANHHTIGGRILGIATDIQAQQLLDDTNNERVKNGLEPLSYSPKLAEAAALKSHHMLINNYWSHFSPNGDSPWGFIKQTGYEYEYAGENLAKNFLYSQNVVDAWMKSPTHRENILRPEFTEVGYAIQNGVLEGEETTLVVQMFAKPLRATASNAAPNAPETTTLGNGEAVLAQSDQNAATAPASTGIMLYIFVGILILALVLDLYIGSRLKIIHVHGKTLAHLVFIIIVTLGALIYLANGAII